MENGAKIRGTLSFGTLRTLRRQMFEVFITSVEESIDFFWEIHNDDNSGEWAERHKSNRRGLKV